MTFPEYRINALTPDKQARHCTETAQGCGVWYNIENGKCHEVEGVCDNVSMAELYDMVLPGDDGQGR